MWMSDFFWGNGFSSLFSILFFLLFFSILGLFFYTFIQGNRQWNKNNHSPRLTVDATVVTKRTDVGKLSFQGTRFLDFQRCIINLHIFTKKVPIFVGGDRSILDFNPHKNRNLLFDPYKTRIFFI